MDQSQASLINERLTRLERANRRWKLLGVFSVVTTAVLVLCGALTTINEQLLIKDRDGTVRFDIGIERVRGLEQGIKIIDKDKKTRIEIGVNKDGNCFLVLTDRDGNSKDLAQ
jgi:hypothetical protein